MLLFSTVIRGLSINVADRFLRKFLAEVADPLIAEGKIKVHPPEVRGEGLKGVLSGLQDLKAGKVSGKKLVYRVEETP